MRRPHAYFFIQDAFEDQGGIASATPAGCTLEDGSLAPLPGVYFLDESGKVLERVALASTGARNVLLEAMKRAAGG